jgi:hypothetical protein
MQLDTPSWYLSVTCPCCGQGQPLFVACPACGTVSLQCAELGTFFPDPRNLQAQLSSASMCPACSKVPIVDFVSASSGQIQSAGFRHGDYV